MITQELDAATSAVLASVAQLVAQTKDAANHATLHAAFASKQGGAAGASTLLEVYGFAKQARETAEQAGKTLSRLGVHAPKAETAEPSVLDLRALASMDTPETRELLRLLDAAQAVAERIDALRGRVVPADLPLEPGESRGTDLAESVSNIAVRVRREVHGGGAGLGE